MMNVEELRIGNPIDNHNNTLILGTIGVSFKIMCIILPIKPLITPEPMPQQTHRLGMVITHPGEIVRDQVEIQLHLEEADHQTHPEAVEEVHQVKVQTHLEAVGEVHQDGTLIHLEAVEEAHRVEIPTHPEAVEEAHQGEAQTLLVVVEILDHLVKMIVEEMIQDITHLEDHQVAMIPTPVIVQVTIARLTVIDGVIDIDLDVATIVDTVIIHHLRLQEPKSRN
jgi:hypothetical protein